MAQSALHTLNVERLPQPWLSSSRWDSAFIFAPAFIPCLLVVLFHQYFADARPLPVWSWVLLVLMVDVSHVYATVFRTYWNKEAFAKNQCLLLAIPLACWVVGALLYSVDALLFWKALAYLAVFHFIRQQYGFVALYSRKDPQQFRRLDWLNAAVIYAATLYPVLYWHAHLPRNFNWFVEGDFTALPNVVSEIAVIIYAIIACAYVVKEIALCGVTRFINIPRNLLVGGTAISWWVGIVSLNSDLAFTMTNVIAHGVPYMALVWLHHGERKQKPRSADSGETFVVSGEQNNTVSAKHSTVDSAKDGTVDSAKSRHGFLRQLALAYVPVFLLCLLFFAYFEEGLWDGLVWREHLQVFPLFAWLPRIIEPEILALLIPFLALPQSTHYVLDGFIWRIKDVNSTWSLGAIGKGFANYARD